MPEPTIRKASLEDAFALGPRLRPAELAEVRAYPGTSPVQALADSLKRSTKAYAADCDGVPFALWGVAPTTALSDAGVIWFLGGSECSRFRFAVGREGRRFVAEALRDYAMVLNYVDARYSEALRFVAGLGFEQGPPLTLGRAGEGFVPVWKIREHAGGGGQRWVTRR